MILKMVDLKGMYGNNLSLKNKVITVTFVIIGIIMLMVSMYTSHRYWQYKEQGIFYAKPVPFVNNGAPSPIYDVHSQCAEYYKGKTYISYLGPGNNPYVLYYNHKTGNWHTPVKVGTNPLQDDCHGAPSLLVDNNGYIHVFYGAHGGPLLHSISASPASISNWVSLTPPTKTATYPQPMLLGNTIVLFYRNGWWNLGADWVVQTSITGGHTWSSKQPVLHGEREPGSYDWYAIAKKINATSFHVGATWSNFEVTNDVDKDKPIDHRNIYYISYRKGTFMNSNKESLTSLLPLTKKEADKKVLVWKGDKYGYPTPSISPNGNPVILFAGENNQTKGGWQLASWHGSKWRISHITRGYGGKATLKVEHGNIHVYVYHTGRKILERWVRKNKWSLEEQLFNASNVNTKDSTISRIKAVHSVRNSNGEAQIIFAQFQGSGKDHFEKCNCPVYLWGSRGYIAR